MLAIFKIHKVIKDIILYRRYKKIINKESKDSPVFSKLNLRLDWVGRIYTVVNLPPEVTMSPDFPKDARPAYVFEEMRPANEYLTKLNLQELLIPSAKPLAENNGDSYLYVYNFYFRSITWGWIFRFILEVIGLWYLYIYFPNIVEFFVNLF
jgi:hypothetical protein